MNVIDTLIFDRTNEDIINETDKAFISYIDLNRIEEACSYLASLLKVSIMTKEWKIDEFRKTSEMERLRNNINLLENSYYKMPNTPKLPEKITYTSITEANNIEKILFDINTMIENVKAAVRFAGTFYAGE